MEDKDPSGEPRLVDVLQDILGLSDSEADTYNFLRRQGESSATEVARGTHQSRGAAYTSVRDLVGAGLAQEIPTRPITFRAMPVKEVLGEARRVSERRIEQLQQVLAASEAAPEDASTPADLLRPGDVTVASGRRAALAELRRGIDDSIRFFWGLAARGASGRILRSSGLLASLKDASHRGVDIRLYLCPTDAVPEEQKRIEDAVAGPTIWTPPSAWDGRATVAITEHAAFFYIPQPATGEASGEDILVRLAGSVFVETLTHLFPKDESNAASSPRSSTWNDVVQACQDAEETVLWMSGSSVDAPADTQREIATALPTSATGRRVRAASVGSLDSERWVERTAASVPFWFLIIDGKRLYQATPPGPGQTGITVRVSEDAEELRFYQDFFERAWERGTTERASEPVETSRKETT